MGRKQDCLCEKQERTYRKKYVGDKDFIGICQLLCLQGLIYRYDTYICGTLSLFVGLLYSYLRIYVLIVLIYNTLIRIVQKDRNDYLLYI